MLCPRACWSASAPPFYCPSARRSDNLSFNVSLSASALLLSCLVQQLIRHPHHPFFPPISGWLPSPFFYLLSRGGACYKILNKSCTNHLVICRFATTDSVFCKRACERVLYLCVLLMCLYIRFKPHPSVNAGLLLKIEWQCCPALTWWIWCRFNCIHIMPLINVIWLSVDSFDFLCSQKLFCTATNKNEPNGD